VRREIALSLRGAEGIARIWAALAAQYDGKDRWYLEALGIGAMGNEDDCLDAWMKMVDNNWNTPAGRNIIWRVRGSQTPAKLAAIIIGNGAADADSPRFLRAFDFLPSSNAKTDALIQLASLGSERKAVAAEALQRLKSVDQAANPAIATSLKKMLQEVKGTPEFVQLVREFGLKDQAPGLLEVVLKDPASPTGVEAAKVLLEPANEAVVLTALSSPDAPKLIQALGNTADQRAVKLLNPILSDANKPAELRRAALKALTQSQAGVQALLTMARNNSFPADLKPVAAQALSAVQLPKFKGEITQLFPMPSAAGGAALPPIAELARQKGDAVRGKEIFTKVEATCVTCHRVGQVGVDFGPGLAEIGSKLGKEALYESIIAPNAGVSMGFETTQLTLKSGDSAVGIVRSETEGDLVLGMPGGVQNTYKKADIAKRDKLPNSMMPEGLQAILPTKDLVDMVEYLSSLKATPSASR
jgi:putative heme-binding domain-containing protein